MWISCEFPQFLVCCCLLIQICVSVLNNGNAQDCMTFCTEQVKSAVTCQHHGVLMESLSTNSVSFLIIRSGDMLYFTPVYQDNGNGLFQLLLMREILIPPSFLRCTMCCNSFRYLCLSSLVFVGTEELNLGPHVCLQSALPLNDISSLFFPFAGFLL